ncbi:MAG TPA: hypothetical protein ENI23_05355 [bacterium]|nr:hypothetical protein [bacterium]
MAISVTIPLDKLLEIQRRIRVTVDAYENLRTLEPIQPFRAAVENLRRTLVSNWLDEEEKEK